MKSVQDIRADRVFGADSFNRHWRAIVAVGAAAADFLAVAAIVIFTSLAYHEIVYDHRGSAQLTTELAVFIASIFVFTNLLQRRYRLMRYLAPRGQVVEAFNSWNLTIVAFIAIGFLAKVIDNYSRAVVVITYFAGIPLVALMRWWVVRSIAAASKTGRLVAQRVMLIGRESDVMSFMARHQPWNSGLMIQHMVVLTEGAETPEQAEADLQADLATALVRARQSRPDSVFIALPWSERDRIERCIEAFLNVPVAINLSPELILDRFQNPRIIKTGSVAALELTPPALTTPEIVLKRLFDLVAASLLLIVSTPLLAVIALLIKLDSKGPVFFLQRRYGFNQQPFRIFKFRTMRTLDDGDEVRQATRDDPRITRVGAWLRRWNLDELPQLINVLLGQMSLVGPRPHALAHDHEFERKIARYARRHNVKPGITGWAQVHGLRGETDTDDKMARRIDYDLWYIDNWNFWLDVIILMRTVMTPNAFRNAR
jgi:Undecaprenyl-phosphate glucose phosphotransferase